MAAIALAPGQGMSLSNETNFQYFLDLLAGRLNSGQALVYFLFTLAAGFSAGFCCGFSGDFSADFSGIFSAGLSFATA